MKTLRVKLMLDLDDKELELLQKKHGKSFKEMVAGVKGDIGEWFFDEYLNWISEEALNEGEE